jgi:hypothetical protein
MRPHARTLAAAVAAMLVLGMVACGGDDDSAAGDTEQATEAADDATTTTAAESSATTAAPTPEDQAVAAYRAAYDAYFAALNPPNPQSPELMAGFSGEALTTMIDTVFRARDDGVYVVGSFEMHPEVASATATEVLLVDCVVETNTTFDAATGAERDSGRYVHNRRATVVNTDGVWSVAAFEHVEEQCTPDAE